MVSIISQYSIIVYPATGDEFYAIQVYRESGHFCASWIYKMII